MPSEWSPHAGTIMTWPTAERISQAFAGSDIEATWTELSNIARAISQFEPVHVFVRDPESYTPPDPTKPAQISSGFASAHTLLQGTTNIELHQTNLLRSRFWYDHVLTSIRRRRHGISASCTTMIPRSRKLIRGRNPCLLNIAQGQPHGCTA